MYKHFIKYVTNVYKYRDNIATDIIGKKIICVLKWYKNAFDAIMYSEVIGEKGFNTLQFGLIRK